MTTLHDRIAAQFEKGEIGALGCGCAMMVAAYAVHLTLFVAAPLVILYVGIKILDWAGIL